MFVDCILDTIFSVQLTYAGNLCVLRSDGIPSDFLDYCKNLERGQAKYGPPLRGVLFDLRPILPEKVVAELESLCRNDETEHDGCSRFYAIELISRHIDSLPLVEALDIFKPKQMELHCKVGDARRERDNAIDELDRVNQQLERANDANRVLTRWAEKQQDMLPRY